MYTPPTNSFEPNEDRIVVQPDDAATFFSEKYNIAIPVAIQQRPTLGTIVAAGPGTTRFPMTYNPGDRVMYGRMAGVDVEDPYDKGKMYLIMRASDVLCRIKKAE